MVEKLRAAEERPTGENRLPVTEPGFPSYLMAEFGRGRNCGVPRSERRSATLADLLS
jgi:hypothetical protein